jgi:hypothetical protein
VDPRAGLDDLEKRKFLTLPGLELRPLGRPASSQSLYRLRYPDSPKKDQMEINEVSRSETVTEFVHSVFQMSFPSSKYMHGYGSPYSIVGSSDCSECPKISYCTSESQLDSPKVSESIPGFS